MSSVRYGNVLASTGSIIPFFKEKIESGEPIPLTHPDMTRFIISADQAVDLVFKALVINIGGEVTVPSIPSMTVVDLISALKKLMDADNEIVEVGIRPGEKIHEILINEYESPLTYKYEDTYFITSLVEQYQEELQKTAYQKDGERLNSSVMSEYSSRNHLLSEEKLIDYLKNLNLL